MDNRSNCETLDMSEDAQKLKHSVMKICKYCSNIEGIARPLCTECGNDKFWRQRDVKSM